MAIVKSGIAKGFSGKVGGLVFNQQADGTTTVQEVPDFSNTLRTIPQLSVWADGKILGVFLKTLKRFIAVAYHLEGKRLGCNANNALVPHLRHDALMGVYPNRSINYSKVLITKGDLPSPEDVTVTVTDYGLAFTWDNEIRIGGAHFSDQIMMLAYFPELDQVRYMTAGSQRHTGKDMLMLTGIKSGFIAEVYVSFITDNGDAISNSVYVGQINW